MKVPIKENEFLDWNENENLNLDFKSNWKKKDFEDAVFAAKEYIRKGDIFQIVLSQRFHTKVNNDPFNLYRSLRMVNPSPYMSFFDFGSWYLIGSSPEVMVKAEKNKNSQIVASLRPIAGTRPRGIDNQQDLELEKELLKDPKEIAEHVMLIDLGRNDLGRVISQRFQTQVNNDPFNLYRSLRMVNPSPYMSFFNFGSWLSLIHI